MKVLVTGATGFIGAQLCLKLAAQGHEVIALFRSAEKTTQLEHANIKLFQGDICDIESLKTSMKGCEVVFHLAAYAKMWAKNKQTFYNINYVGTENVLQIAHLLTIKKVIIASTAGVLGPSSKSVIDEQSIRKVPYFNEYEETKAKAEVLVKEYVQKGSNIVMVNPTRVYGPGQLTESNGVTRMIKSYYQGFFRTIPGNGTSIGNYAYIDDVVSGFLLAMEKGKSGERYILGGENISYNDFFKVVAQVTGRKYTMINLHLSFMIGFAWLMVLQAKLVNSSPFITPEWARKFNHNWALSSEKAQQELGYTIIPLEEGVRRTLSYLKEQQHL